MYSEGFTNTPTDVWKYLNKPTTFPGPVMVYVPNIASTCTQINLPKNKKGHPFQLVS